VDVETLDEQPEPAELALNDIGRVRLLASAPVIADPYARELHAAAGLEFAAVEVETGGSAEEAAARVLDAL
jgi:sulfate adenylyltransferase subunit 1 (EFTu-like GTPase family)